MPFQFKYTLLLSLSWLMLIAHAGNNSYHFEFNKSLTVADGLASNEVNCILQDTKGFMWFGTRNGLSRYDGYSFKTYKSNFRTPDFFSNNNIKCIAEDKQHALWIGTMKGVNKINLITGELTRFRDTVFSKLHVFSIVVADNNTPYFGTENGLYFFNRSNEQFQRILTDRKGTQMPFNYVKTLFVDSKNFLWIGSWEKGFAVYNLNTNTFIRMPYLNNKASLIVNSFFEDRDNNIWITTWDQYGVYRIESPHQPQQSKITIFYPQKSENSVLHPVVYSVAEDTTNGNIVLATANGLQIIPQSYRYSNTVQLDDTNSQQITGDEIFSVFRDRSGLLWYSRYGMGVNALNPNQYRFDQYNLSHYLGKDNQTASVNAIYEDRKGIVWLGLKSVGLALFNPVTDELIVQKSHPVLSRIPGKANSVYSFLKTGRNDELWVGTRYEGLYSVLYKNSVIESVNYKPIPGIDSKNLSIFTMVESNKQIWVGTNKGLFVAQWNTHSHRYDFMPNVAISRLFKNQVVNKIIVDQHQRVWVGTRNKGLYKIVRKGSNYLVFNYSMQNKRLNSNEVLAVLEDYKNRIWVGTNGGGLSLYNPGMDKFRMIDNMSLIPDDAINSIEEDSWGNLWLATGNGLVCYNEDKSVDKKIRLFSGKEGIWITSFNSNATYRNSSNVMFFGGKNGYVSFSPEKEDINSFTPQPVICNLSVNNQSLDLMSKEERNNILNQDIAFAGSLHLKHNQNNVLIEFSALLYENIPAIKFAYKLNGVDEDWVYVDSQKRFANYNNLSAGNYSFQVKSCNAQGSWCKTPTTLDIVIQPAPWNSVYAYLLYLIAAIMIVYLITRFILNRIRLLKRIDIEQIERRKNEEIHQAKLMFFTNISHEFFTPITILKVTLDDFIRSHPVENKTMTILRANMNRLVRLVEQIVEFRKIDAGQMKLKISRIEVVEFVRELIDNHFKPICESGNISLTFNSSTTQMYVYVDADKLDKILFNLLSNAFKYNKPHGKIKVTVDSEIRNQTSYLLITVSDTGYGMSEDVKQNLFKRFFEGNLRNSKIRSRGIGLSLVHDLVEFHNGEISVDSIENVGSTFRVAIPVSKEVYDEGQMFQEEITDLDETEIIASRTDSTQVALSHQVDNTKVLLVEDNKELQQAMCVSLKTEFNLVIAQNGVEALNKLANMEIDIVVTDIVMPDMDGIRLTQTMKERMEFSHIPVIILTAKHEAEHKVEGFEAGADAYITKPFEMCVLSANIRSLVRNRKRLARSFRLESDSDNITSFAHNETDKQFLSEIVKMIEENILQKDFNTSVLYEHFNMSQSTLYRKLQALIGVSPNELIRKIKIQLASKLLLEGNLNVSQVAYDLGFSDPKYFSNIFKKETGLRPTEFIRQTLKNESL